MKTVVQYLPVICVIASVSFGAFDHTISNTYEYDVKLENESLLVTGGGAELIWAKYSSYVEIENTLPLQIDVGGIADLSVDDSSSLNYFGGETDLLKVRNNATASLRGGRINYISSYQDADDLVQVGWDYENNVPIFRKHIEMIVRQWAYNSQTKVLSGVWNVDNNNDSLFDTFTIQLHNQTGYDPVIDNITFTIIPEPLTLLLFGMGGILLRRKGYITRQA